METTMMQMIKEYGRNIHLLIAEDDLVMQAFYRRMFDGIFETFTIKNNGSDAYDYICDPKIKPVDLIITDNYMPVMNGMELVQKVRERDFGVRIIVITSEADYNLMHNYMLNGVDAILPKPYNQELTMKVLHRTLHYINEKKLLEHYVEQLECMAKENIARKSAELKQRGEVHTRTPKLNKSEAQKSQTTKSPTLEEKYMIRNSVNDMEHVDVESLDIIGKERIEIFQEQISDLEFALCSVEDGNIPALRIALMDVLEGIRELVRTINVLGVFPIAANAATNLIRFIEKLDNSELQDREKRELFIDILVSMLEDFDKWIDMVFISKRTENIHYFDASFANTCLELEMIFKVREHKRTEAEVLEFF